MLHGVMARLTISGRLAFGQVDFFDSGSRKTGIVWSDLEAHSFVNGEVLSWGIADGAAVSDSTIGAGAVYFNEVSGASGFYLIRFFPDRIGFWRIVLNHSTLGEVILEFDVLSPTPQISGLQASFGS